MIKFGNFDCLKKVLFLDYDLDLVSLTTNINIVINFKWASTKKNRTKHVGLVQSGDYYHLIECNLFSPWYSWKFVHFALSTINHSLNQRVSISCSRNDSIMYDDNIIILHISLSHTYPWYHFIFAHIFQFLVVRIFLSLYTGWVTILCSNINNRCTCK